MARSIFCSLFVVLVIIFASVLSEKILFKETFEEDVFVTGKWVKSQQLQYIGQPVKVLPTGEDLPGLNEEDKGIQLTQEMKHYGFASEFTSPITAKDHEGLFIQYEVKFLEQFNCGGAYIKLLREDLLSLDLLDNATPYSIMFGPDKCGTTNKIHFIMQYQNPVDGTWEEKHYNETIPFRADKHTHLYTLALHQDNSFEIFVDNKEAKKGSLLTHFIPAINPEKMIADPTDFKPSDWVVEAEIVDPSAVKPDDWDESQPRKIVDATAAKPSGWLDNEPDEIPNTDIKKPDDWLDEEDGEWEAPTIPNPVCETAPGCGAWKPPTIDNPLYKGKWLPPKISNPAYKGVWAPRQIPNPTYYHHESPYQHIAPITALAVEVWTTNSGVHFDNFIITDNVRQLHEFTDKTFEKKKEGEKAAVKEESRLAREKERARVFSEGTLTEKLPALVHQVFEYFSENPIALGISIVAIVVPFIYLLLFGGKTASVQDDGQVEQGEEPVPTTGANETKEKKDEDDQNKEEDSKQDEKKKEK